MGKNYNFSKLNIIVLLVPIVYLFAAVLQVLFSIELGTYSSVSVNFISNFILLNSVHVAFTYFGLANLKPFKNLLNSNKGAFKFFKFKALLFFCAVFVAHWNIDLLGIEAQNITYFILFSVYITHPLFQSYGMSLLYNEKEGQTPQLSLIILEKRVFKVLYFLLLGFAFLQFSLLPSALAPYKNKLEILLVASFLVITLYLIFSLVRSRLLFHEKGVFLIRLFLYPLMFKSNIALLGLNAAHGVEYLAVSKNVLKNSKFSFAEFRLSKNILAILVALIIIVLAIFGGEGGLYGFINNGVNPQGHWYKLLWVSFVSFTYLHYYIDRNLFKFSNPQVKNEILPLLRSSSKQ